MASPHTCTTIEQTYNRNEEAASEAEVEGVDEEDERVGLLGYTRMLNQKPTPIEIRLAIVAFFCLCLAAVGFGLFAGEVSKLHRSGPIDGHPVKVITTTIYLSPTNVPSPPGKSSDICSSGPCVDVAARLRQTIAWGVNPCEDFAKFTTIGVRQTASEEIFSEIDQTINKVLLSNDSSSVVQKIREFNLLCSRKSIDVPYHHFSPILREVSDLFGEKASTQTESLGSVLAYLHSASLSALFKTTIVNERLILHPHITSTKGIEDAFISIYPSDEAQKRIQGVKLLVARLAALSKTSKVQELISLEDLQTLSCASSWIPCWICWKDYYSALNINKPVRQLDVHGIEYFAQLGRVIAEQESAVLESYFHWVTIFTIRQKDCLKEVKTHFGPSLIRNLFLTYPAQLVDWKHKIQSAQLVLRSLLDLAPDLELPRVIMTPSINPNQEEELSSIRKGDWVGTAFELARIKTRKEFAEGQSYWDEFGTKLSIVGDQLLLPWGALQAPLLYPFFADLPKSIFFGSFGFGLMEELLKINANSSFPFQNTCPSTLSKSFQLWKKYQKSNRNENKNRIVGLVQETQSPDQLFYLAFGRLGLACPGLEKNQDFIDSFNCTASKE